MSNEWQYKRNNGVQPVGDDVRVDVNMIGVAKERLGVEAGKLSWEKQGILVILSWRLHVEEKADKTQDGYPELKVTESVNHKQERYTNDDGQDLIDEWATKLTHAEFRAVMFAMIEKYNRRLGKKAPIIEEVEKMADYMQRWHEYEIIWDDES